MKLLDCEECARFLDEKPHLIGAAASVGIEQNKSTEQMLLDYLRAYHKRGHEETP